MSVEERKRHGQLKGYNCRFLKPPSEPTAAYPGTPQKVEIMELRIANGELPHHPKDAKRE